LTGRENIFLNGAILGMSRAEIQKKFDEIVEFSEIERFLDTPVKRYSSGMYIRLGFAVAAHLEPEILIVDEVLAVGDVQFQKKCLGKMENVAKEGRTVLFVSHNMAAIRDLCKRAVWLDSGRCVGDGEVNEVVSQYLHKFANSIHEAVWEDPRTAPGNQKVRLHRARLSVPPGFSSITIRTPLDAEFEYWNLIPDAKLGLSLHMCNLEGVCIFNSDSTPRNYPIGLIREICHIPGDLLNDGTYNIKIVVVQESSFGIYEHEDILVFDAIEGERDINWYGKWPGAVRPTATASTIPATGYRAASKPTVRRDTSGQAGHKPRRL
jgi:lipopolysaccharide transport system ATP-binding protein